MSTAAIIELISFALTEAPVVFADIQALANAAQQIQAGQTPSEELAALAAAVAARKAAVAAATGTTQA